MIYEELQGGMLEKEDGEVRVQKEEVGKRVHKEGGGGRRVQEEDTGGRKLRLDGVGGGRSKEDTEGKL